MTAARIIIAEDEALIAMELADRLRKLGYDVVGVTPTGAQTLVAVAEHEPDLLLLDINLAGEQSGIDVARDLRDRNVVLPVVFLTAFSGSQTLQEASALEPAGYLVKPFDERELHATLQVALFRANAENERRLRLEERREWEERLQCAEKDASLGRMAAAVTHSFSNAMAGVLGFVQLARMDVRDTKQCEVNLDEALQSIQSVVELIESIRSYADPVPRDRVVELSQICREMTPLLASTLPENISLSLQAPSPGPRVLVDAKLLQQALVHLVTNAAEAMAAQTGEVCISVAPELDESRSWRTYPRDWQPDEQAFACVEVRDEGPGVATDAIDSIFDPFFSTKFLGRGLGLAVVLATVRSMGGAVALETSERGSRFCLLLPIAPEEPRP